MRRWIRRARLVSISCLTTAQASASQGQGRRCGRKLGSRREQRAEQWVATEAAEELGEVVVDAEREAHPLYRQLELLRARARLDRRGGAAAADRRCFPGCQARTTTGLPATCSNRDATPSRTLIVRSSLLPRGSRQGEGGRTSSSSRPTGRLREI